MPENAVEHVQVAAFNRLREEASDGTADVLDGRAEAVPVERGECVLRHADLALDGRPALLLMKRGLGAGSGIRAIPEPLVERDADRVRKVEAGETGGRDGDQGGALLDFEALQSAVFPPEHQRDLGLGPPFGGEVREFPQRHRRTAVSSPGRQSNDVSAIGEGARKRIRALQKCERRPRRRPGPLGIGAHHIAAPNGGPIGHPEIVEDASDEAQIGRNLRLDEHHTEIGHRRHPTVCGRLKFQTTGLAYHPPMRLLLILASTLAVASPIAAQDAPRPNILWLVVEDMSPWLASYGDDTVETPHLDRLAAQSIRYTNAFASSPVCAPARSSLITGMYATRIGTMHMRTGNPSGAALAVDPDAYASIPSYEGVPPDFVRCFPEHLRAAGYYCTNTAKTDYQFKAPATTWDASGGKAHWRNRSPEQPFFAVFNHAGTHESRAFPGTKRAPSRVDPKTVPLPPYYPDTPAVRDAVARTYDNIAAMDAWVGKRLAELDEAGLADSTYVFFYSDHGAGLPRGKRSPYDFGTRVPLLIRAPDGGGAGSDDNRVVSFIDFGPTVQSLAGMRPDSRLDGIPFLGAHARPGTGFAFTHADRFDAVYDRARSVSDGRYRYVRNYDTAIPHLIPNAYRYKLPMMADLDALRDSGTATPEQWQAVSVERPREEFYDSQSDPWEVRNRADDPQHQERLQQLRAALDGWLESTGDLGLQTPERAMVETHLWPGGDQPQTLYAEVRVADGQISLSSATPGASLGYRAAKDGPWTVYRGPFPASELPSIEVLAHRIGYRPSVRLHELN